MLPVEPYFTWFESSPFAMQLMLDIFLAVPFIPRVTRAPQRRRLSSTESVAATLDGSSETMYGGGGVQSKWYSASDCRTL